MQVNNFENLRQCLYDLRKDIYLLEERAKRIERELAHMDTTTPTLPIGLSVLDHSLKNLDVYDMASLVRDRSVLTVKQSEIASMILLGYDNLQIITRLGVVENTIKFHLSSIYSLFKIDGRIKRTKLIRRLEELVNTKKDNNENTHSTDSINYVMHSANFKNSNDYTS